MATQSIGNDFFDFAGGNSRLISVGGCPRLRQSGAEIDCRFLALRVNGSVVDSRRSLYKIPLASFYSVPVFVSAWFCGKKWGIAAAASASLIWWYVKWSTGDPILNASSGAGATSWRFGFFLIVALAGSALRTKSDIAADRITLLERGLRRLEREIVNISEAEQRRIGQDLHDGVCQYLAGLTCGASSLRDDLEKLDVRAERPNA